MGDDAEYYFETMMQDPHFRAEQRRLEEKRQQEEKFKSLVKKNRAAVQFLSKPAKIPAHNLTIRQICDQLRIHRSVYYACLEPEEE